MNEILIQQKEAYDVMCEYLPKLKTGIVNVCAELTSNKLPDTYEYLKQIIAGLNWVIEIYNRIPDLLTENNCSINKSEANRLFENFSAVYASKNDFEIAEALTAISNDFLAKL